VSSHLPVLHSLQLKLDDGIRQVIDQLQVTSSRSRTFRSPWVQEYLLNVMCLLVNQIKSLIDDRKVQETPKLFLTINFLETKSTSC
jgi:hypothetical protein